MPKPQEIINNNADVISTAIGAIGAVGTIAIDAAKGSTDNRTFWTALIIGLLGWITNKVKR